jgi:LPS-assembly lipoprotein
VKALAFSSIRRLFLMSVCAVLVSACGFQLRDAASLPPEMDQTRLVIDDRYSQLSRHLQNLLERNGVQIVDGDAATAVLEVMSNRVVTEVLTIGDSARVREYRISHTVEFRLTDGAGAELIGPQTLRQSRELAFDEQAILANSREEEYLRADLAKTMARLMVARLESLYVSQG